MTEVFAAVECRVHDSFRVQQVAAMFDLPPQQTLRRSFAVEVPGLDQPWQIGAIVGPSGSGKTTVARAALGDALYTPGDWPADRAVIDGFGDRPIHLITRTLTAVGLGSPPCWLKPHRVLSTGEKFRCELARALLRGAGLETGATSSRARQEACATTTVVFDEFTSVVDRTVARVASAAVSRAIRRGHVAARLVAVTCHNDILPWLAPDWVLDMATGELVRGRLRQPAIRLAVVRARHAAWQLFAGHHYLSGGLSRGAKVYMAVWDERPAALCAVVALYGHAGRRRIHRLVTLPEFQGIGIGSRLLDRVAEMETAAGHRVSITASHPAVIAHCRNSPRWQAVALRTSGAAQQKSGRPIRGSQGRATVSFEFGERGVGKLNIENSKLKTQNSKLKTENRKPMSLHGHRGTFDVPYSRRAGRKTVVNAYPDTPVAPVCRRRGEKTRFSPHRGSRGVKCPWKCPYHFFPQEEVIR